MDQVRLYKAPSMQCVVVDMDRSDDRDDDAGEICSLSKMIENPFDSRPVRSRRVNRCFLQGSKTVTGLIDREFGYDDDDDDDDEGAAFIRSRVCMHIVPSTMRRTS